MTEDETRSHGTHLTPLPRLQIEIDSDHLDLAPESGLLLRRVTNADREKHFGISDYHDKSDSEKGWTPSPDHSFQTTNLFRMNEAHDLYSAEWLAESTLGCIDHREELQNLLLALRMLAPSGVVGPVTFNDTTPALECTTPFRSQAKARLTLSDEDDHRELRQNLRLVHEVLAPDANLLRLVSEEGPSTMSMVFLSMIVERTLLRNPGERKTEIAFKVRTYGAKLLSKYANQDAKAAYSTLKDLYNVRSKFVHEAKAEPVKWEDFAAAYRLTTSILRTAIQNPDALKADNRTDLLLA